MRLKVASRKSDLARWQSVQVARSLATLPQSPEIEFLFKASLGDQDLDTPLARMGGRGVFTEDFHEDLINGTCDLVVHSWKDLPTEERVATQIAMTLPRADVRDLLVVPNAAWASAVTDGTLRVLTSSPRRVYNLGACLAKLLPAELKVEFVEVRGNVPTRLGKMRSQNSALVLAKAGLDRLLQAESEGFLGETSLRALIEDCRFMVLPISLNPAAPAQGALAVEIKRENESMQEFCKQLTHEQTAKSVLQERSILSRYGGGCHQKIGATILPREYGEVLSLRGLTDSGEILHQWTITNSTPWSKAKSKAAIFPLEPKQNSWFERTELTTEAARIAKAEGLIIARAEALPEKATVQTTQWVWAAGVQTWERLAKRGIWVNGTFDGLGESEPMALEHIAGPLKWSKLSHTAGHSREDIPMIATYSLSPKTDAPDLKDKTHFFWMSSTSFERARQLFPDQIKKGFHAAGPGSTFEHLRNTSGLDHPPKVFIGLEQFLGATI